jgi:sulfite exporter TauE/SafE/copper chaperone CopZ
MGASAKTVKLRISGMTCTNCESRIEKNLRNISGVQSVKTSYSTGEATIVYDTKAISLENIIEVIEKLNYKVRARGDMQAPEAIRIAGMLIIIVALYMLLQHFGILNMLVPHQLANAEMAYGMLFIIGLMTSVHCLAMCGGINLSQCISHGFSSPFMYSLGRVISYTSVGFVVGALGSVIDFSTTMQGMLKLIAGVFMLIMGINLLGIFPWLHKLNTRMPQYIAKRINAEKAKNKSPLIVGLLNGFMPCGPLQAMQLYALSTGSPVKGALSMFLFSLGTVPLTFSFGAFSSMLGQKFTRKAVTVGAILVIVLGMSMFTDGWNLSGLTIPESSASRNVQSADFGNMLLGGRGGCGCGMGAGMCEGHGLVQGAEMSRLSTEQPSKEPTKVKEDIQIIKSTISPYRYPDITVKANTPVKWFIDAPNGSINGCNNRIFIREYGIEHTFKIGENIIEFTPAKTGKFLYTCWMGMMRATITVVEG